MVEVDMFSALLYDGLQNKITLNFDSKFHDSYLMKCLHNSITKIIQYGDYST